MTQAGMSERRLVGVSELTPERLAELRRIAEAATPGPWAVNPFRATVDEMRSMMPICGLLWPTDQRTEEQTLANATHIATFDPATVIAILYEIERLRQAVDALQLDRRTLEDVISVLEQEQRRAGRYLEDARDELAHGRIQSAEHRIIDALVSLSSKERRTDTRLKTAVKSGGGCD